MISNLVSNPLTSGDLGAPRPDSLVLTNRPLRPDAPPDQLSKYDDARWYLSAGIFEDHKSAVSIGFRECPAAFANTLKHYLWLLINTDIPVTLRRGKTQGVPSLTTLPSISRYLTTFLIYLDIQSVRTLSGVTPDHYDKYLTWVRELDKSLDVKQRLIAEVRRIWAYREQLPTADQLPHNPPMG